MNENTQTYLNELFDSFQRQSDPLIAVQQQSYMQNKFKFFGIKTPDRRCIQKPFVDGERIPSQQDIPDVIHWLWQKEERELQMFGIDLLVKYKPVFRPNDITLLEFMIVNKSWWDSVDTIASNLVGPYFMRYPGAKDFNVNRWLGSNDIWLQRTCLLFQLKYKDNTDLLTLTNAIDRLIDSDEFFIRKAIGWALRQYSRIDSNWVKEFANKSELSQLSRKEALKLIV